ncbi:MAG: hypothetical protein ACREDF_00415, partial [Thermoplasmata archaeon]
MRCVRVRGFIDGQQFLRLVSFPRRLQNWLLDKNADPSVRHRVLRELLDKPVDDPAVVREQKQIGRKGWAAQILRLQHPAG